MTYLELVNKVLVKLRESKVSSVDETEFSASVGEFVKQAISEVEDAWDWHILRTTIQITTESGTFDYVLTGAGTSWDVLQVFEDTEDYELRRAPSYQQMNRWLLANNVPVQQPTYWDWNGSDISGDPVVNFYPIPDSVYSINFNLKIKTQFDDGDETRIFVPALPIVLRAYALAVEERGEDGGVTPQSVNRQASTALADAISYDILMYEAEQVWETV